MKNIDSTKQRSFSAIHLTILLSLVMLLIVGATVAALYVTMKSLSSYAVTVSHKKVDATASNNNIQAYEKLKQALVDNKDASTKYGSLKAESEFPEFKVVDIVKKIAGQNNLSITSFNYSDGSSSASGTAAGSASGASSTPPAASSAPVGATASGNTFSLIVNFPEHVNYRSFLQFLYDTEQTVPKLQVDGVSVSPVAGSSSQVSVEPLTIKMYVKGS